MINISPQCRTAYMSDFLHKNLVVEFPALDLVYGNESIDEESLQIKESILKQASIEFVGCIASYLKVNIYNADENLKGKAIHVYITDDITEETIELFHGIVNSVKKGSYDGIKTIEAYDQLYNLSNVDVTSWYNQHTETTVEALLVELLRKVGIGNQATNLVNAEAVALCGTKRKANQLSALDLLKQICQINGCFGRIGRNGTFEVLYLGQSSGSGKLAPASTLFPSNSIFPNMDIEEDSSTGIPSTELPEYEKLTYQEFMVNPIDKVVIRDDEKTEGIFYGTGTNKYIIQANLFAFDIADNARKELAKKIYNSVNGITYRPFELEGNGLPFLECGDKIFCYDYNVNTDIYIAKEFFIFERNLRGIQAMRDTISAQGLEHQNEFITDLKARMDALQKSDSKSEEERQELEELKRRVARLEAIVGAYGTTFAVAGTYKEKPIAEQAYEASNAYVSDAMVVKLGE